MWISPASCAGAAVIALLREDGYKTRNSWLSSYKNRKNLGLCAVQEYFTKLFGEKLTHESKDKIRDVMSAVLRSAVHHRLLDPQFHSECASASRSPGATVGTLLPHPSTVRAVDHGDRGASRHDGVSRFRPHP